MTDHAVILLDGVENAAEVARSVPLSAPLDVVAAHLSGHGAGDAPGVLFCRWTGATVEVVAFGSGVAVVAFRDLRVQRAGGTGCWPIADVDAVLLGTAGVDAVDRLAAGNVPHWYELLQLVAAGDGVQALVDHVHGVEGRGPGRPRPRMHDEKTAVLIMTSSYGDRYRYQPPFSMIAAAGWAQARGEHDEAAALYLSAGELVTSVAGHVVLDNDWHSALNESRLGYVDALALAGRLDELAALAPTDRHARRRLDRQLHDEGRADDLRARAADGDPAALYLLIRLLRDRGDDDAARQAVADIDPDNAYARELADGTR